MAPSSSGHPSRIAHSARRSQDDGRCEASLGWMHREISYPRGDHVTNEVRAGPKHSRIREAEDDRDIVHLAHQLSGCVVVSALVRKAHSVSQEPHFDRIPVPDHEDITSRRIASHKLREVATDSPDIDSFLNDHLVRRSCFELLDGRRAIEPQSSDSPTIDSIAAVNHTSRSRDTDEHVLASVKAVGEAVLASIRDYLSTFRCTEDNDPHLGDDIIDQATGGRRSTPWSHALRRGTYRAESGSNHSVRGTGGSNAHRFATIAECRDDNGSNRAGGPDGPTTRADCRR